MGIINSNQDLTPDAVWSNIEMPEELQEAYERIVLAGMKILFSQGTNRELLKRIDGPGPIGIRLGKGMATLMLLLFKQSNQTIPPNVIIPAGLYLLSQAADFLKKTEVEEVTNKDIADSMVEFINTLITSFGGDTQKMYELFDRYSEVAQ
jgi:hypothetical protein